MPQIVGIKFRRSSKVYYFSPNEIQGLRVGEWVVVETARGREVGKVAFVPRDCPEKEIPGKLKDVLHRASALDLTQMEKYQQREENALQRCSEKVDEYGLPMKVITAEYNYDGTYLTFYFAAEKRVDFRELVKDLARIFRTRIELRQVGVRDEVKLIKGYGQCGRPHCCSTWMGEFRPISIRMAKKQDLPLSPMEISGTCGRLLCCLSFEHELYCEVKSKMPRIGKNIETPWGVGRVKGLNVLQETVTVELKDQATATLSLDELNSQSISEDKSGGSSPRKKKGARSKK